MNSRKYFLKNKKTIINYILFVLFIILIYCIANPLNVEATTTSEIKNNFDSAYNSLSSLTSKITTFLVGLSIISGFATLIYHLIRLGAAGGNPQARAKVLQDMFTTVICISLLGSLTIVVKLVIVLLKT